MVRRCCVVTCRNGRASSAEADERVSYFRVPTDRALYERWVSAIGATGSHLRKTSAICERHFKPDEVRRVAVTRDSQGNIIFQRPLIKYSLEKEVVPSIFIQDVDDADVKKIKKRKVISDQPKNSNEKDNAKMGNEANTNSTNYGNIVVTFNGNPSNLVNFNVTPNNLQTVLTTPTHAKGQENISHTFNGTNTPMVNGVEALERITNHGSTNYTSDLNVQASKEPITIIVPQEEIMILRESANLAQKKTSTPHYPLPESQVQMNIRVFDHIFHNAHKIKLPNPMWGYHKNSVDKDIIIFSKAKWFKSDVLIPPIYEKQVVFHESGNIKIYINAKFSPREVRRPSDIHEMETILTFVDEILVCPGGPSINDRETAHCAQKDHAIGRWRHKLCPIILTDDKTICDFCCTINKVMRYPKKKTFGRKRPRRPPPPSPSPPPRSLSPTLHEETAS